MTIVAAASRRRNPARRLEATATVRGGGSPAIWPGRAATRSLAFGIRVFVTPHLPGVGVTCDAVVWGIRGWTGDEGDQARCTRPGEVIPNPRVGRCTDRDTGPGRIEVMSANTSHLHHLPSIPTSPETPENRKSVIRRSLHLSEVLLTKNVARFEALWLSDHCPNTSSRACRMTPGSGSIPLQYSIPNTP